METEHDNIFEALAEAKRDPEVEFKAEGEEWHTWESFNISDRCPSQWYNIPGPYKTRRKESELDRVVVEIQARHGLTPNTIKSIRDLLSPLFQELQSLRQELEDRKTKASDFTSTQNLKCEPKEPIDMNKMFEDNPEHFTKPETDPANTFSPLVDEPAFTDEFHREVAEKIEKSIFPTYGSNSIKNNTIQILKDSYNKEAQ